MDLEALHLRIREDLDDKLPEGAEDDSAALWKDHELDHYFDQAQRRFISETYYLHDILKLPVIPDLQEISLPVRVLEVRGRRGFLQGAQQEIEEREFASANFPRDDYGQVLQSSPFMDEAQRGRPQMFTLDATGEKITLYPIPRDEDMLSLPVYFEPRETVAERGCLEIQNRRHIEFILEGAKAMAYRKHDVDVYDPALADYWQAMFERRIDEVRGERMRRRRTPGQIQYGGL